VVIIINYYIYYLGGLNQKIQNSGILQSNDIIFPSTKPELSSSSSKKPYVQYSPPFSSEFTFSQNNLKEKNNNSMFDKNYKNPNITPVYLYEPLFSVTVPFLNIENKMLYLVYCHFWFYYFVLCKGCLSKIYKSILWIIFFRFINILQFPF
jgi:hypothetical protein